MIDLKEKFGVFYQPYILGILTISYIGRLIILFNFYFILLIHKFTDYLLLVGELGHYLIGVTSKATAIDLHYGDHACQLNYTGFEKTELEVQCDSVFEENA